MKPPDGDGDAAAFFEATRDALARIPWSVAGPLDVGVQGDTHRAAQG
jgi:hypothetical protein